MSEVWKNFIGGEWVESRSGETFERRNPATGEVVGTFTKSNAGDVDEAVAAASKAFRSWRLVPAPKRGEILYRTARILEERKNDLAREMTQEMGKVFTEAAGDVQEAIDMTYYMAGEGRRMFGQTTPSELRNKFNMSVRKPLGVAGMITPWNFPMAIPSWKMTPALVAGNTIVFKPATYTPKLAIRFVEVLQEAGIPDGVVNLVIGSGPDVGDPLVSHPDVPLLSFTGSTETGTRVATEAAKMNKRVTLEMGGKNAVIVMDDADLDLATEGILWGAFGTTGQRCTATSRVVVHASVKQELEDRLAARASKMQLGDGLLESTDIGPIVSDSQLQNVHNYIDIGRDEGARLVTGGEIRSEGELGKGFFHEPTIFSDVSRDMRIANEEIFGPVVSLIPVDGLDEAIDIANSVQYGLSAAIFTQNVNNAFRAMQDIYTGILYINAGTTGAEIHLPFGGTKGTGNGHREAGTAALDFYMEWQAIYVDYSGKLQRAQIDTDKPLDEGQIAP
ncbi:MAG TPA: aldehyde dehydrogenase family protein [Thermomicrobiales bacterium]|nr:aldehyde dehydrogenase family protein [Thermomicrobiales bacterium]